jgi:hypothetical protein
MNLLRFRVIFALVLGLAIYIHGEATASLPNTDAGMLLFHGSAATVDFFLLYSVPRLLESQLCDDMQTLCLVSIVGNALGWALYMAEFPPVFYNTFMWGLSYVQWARLFMVDRHDANAVGCDLVRRPHLLGA